MNDIQKLEAQLEKLKKEKEDNAWKELSNKYDRIGKWAIGKEFIQFHTNHSWSVFKVTGYEHSWDTSSGAYGQWDKRRFFVFKGEMFGMSTFDRSTSWSISGSVDFKDIEGTAEVRVNGITLGIPLKPKEQWASAWKRFIELGEVSFEQILLSIGEDAYKERNIEEASKALLNFQSFLNLAPEGMFDELRDNYIKRVMLGYELYKKYSADRVVQCKRINWNLI
jgi:hypothetical protein